MECVRHHYCNDWYRRFDYRLRSSRAHCEQRSVTWACRAGGENVIVVTRLFRLLRILKVITLMLFELSSLMHGSSTYMQLTTLCSS